MKNSDSIVNIDSYRNQNSLDKRLNEITLSQSKIDEIKKGKTIKTIKDKVLGSFKIGELIQTIVNWNDDVNKELKKEKEKILLSSLLDKVEQNQLQLNVLIDFLKNPYGLSLTNKIFEILNQSPPDEELINHLSNILKNITKSDFITMFEKHKFFINLIEKLSIHSLTILLDNENWAKDFKPKKEKGGYHINMGKITTKWTDDFARDYIKNKGLDEKNISLLNIVDYSTNNLLSNNIIQNKKDDTNGNGIELTELGKELREYLE